MKNKSKIKAILSIVLVILLTISTVSCAPREMRKGVKVDRDYPDDIIPIYFDSIVYQYENNDDIEFQLLAGTKDDIDDVVDFYEDHFDDEDITPDNVKDKKTKYQADGIFQGFTYEVVISEPKGNWQKLLYNTIIEIEIKDTKTTTTNTNTYVVPTGSIEISDNQIAIDILQEINNDLLIIDEIVVDMLSDEDLTIEQSLVIIDAHKSSIDTIMSSIISRKPNETELIHLQNSELILFEISNEIMLEFIDIFQYASNIISIFDTLLEEVNSAQTKNYSLMQTDLYDSFYACTTSLESITVPSFMMFQHNDIIDKLTEFNTLTYNAIYDLDNEDYLKISSNTYFYDYYLRSIDAYSIALDNDFSDRLSKFEDDFAYINEWSTHFKYFIENSINTNTIDLSLYNSEYLDLDNEVFVSYTLNTPDIIIPANYRSMDYLAFLQLWSNRAEVDVMVTVEIPEYTQKYQEKITITRAETEMAIRPPFLSEISEKLNSSKDAQVVITVENIGTGEMIIQQTNPVKLYSIYDMQWYSDDNIPYFENILSWVTPENDEILTLLRHAADSISPISNGRLTSIVGYQGANESTSKAQITYWQTAAIMHAMSYTMDVKYVNAAFSSTDSNLQRIATPQRVLQNASGLCIETAVTLASALQSAGMNTMILMMPGHAQVAVETWYDSGEYILVETTALDYFRQSDFESYIIYYTKDEWDQYIINNEVTAISCEMADILKIYPID